MLRGWNPGRTPGRQVSVGQTYTMEQIVQTGLTRKLIHDRRAEPRSAVEWTRVESGRRVSGCLRLHVVQ